MVREADNADHRCKAITADVEGYPPLPVRRLFPWAPIFLFNIFDAEPSLMQGERAQNSLPILHEILFMRSV